jgi:neutral ceramidase
MLAGTAKTDITPQGSVRMDGMIRAHGSTGVHDPLQARALVLSESSDLRQAFALISVQVCAIDAVDATTIRARAEARAGIPAERIVVAAHHNHSGPATHGFFDPPEKAYVDALTGKLAELVADAASSLASCRVTCGWARNDGISEYRRLLHRDGHVVMNWEPYEPGDIVRRLGEADPEVGVCLLTAAEGPPARTATPGQAGRVVCLLFNHAVHPNVLSGDSYLLSGEFTGLAERLLEAEFGGTAIFANGAQGSIDVDGHGPRDWAEMERLGRLLAASAAEAARAATSCGIASGSNDSATSRRDPNEAISVPGESREPRLRVARTAYTVPRRRISPAERSWAEEILARTGGTITPMADGVGDDYVALLLRGLWESPETIPVEQTCFAVGDCAFLTFPGELYTEIGLRIKAASPFAHTYIVGLADGYIGYVPTRQAIAEGGYAENTRHVDGDAEEIITERSLALLRSIHADQTTLE